MRGYRLVDGIWRFCGMRTIQKSIRITKEVYEYIMQQEGTNFSDKLNCFIEKSIDCSGSM